MEYQLHLQNIPAVNSIREENETSNIALAERFGGKIYIAKHTKEGSDILMINDDVGKTDTEIQRIQRAVSLNSIRRTTISSLF